MPTGSIRKFCDVLPGYEPLSVGYGLLANAERLYGHNIIGYDIPVLRKLIGFSYPIEEVRDTLLLAQIIWPEIRDADFSNHRKGNFPAKLIGSHSLKAWGLRLGEHKDDFGETSDWQICTPEMVEYCAQDLRTNYELAKAIGKALSNGALPHDALVMEMKFAALCNEVTDFGFPFDTKKAAKLYGEVSARSTALNAELQKAFPPLNIESVIIPKRDNKTLGYKKGVPCRKVKVVPLNPKSRDQLAKSLQNKYGWQAPVETGTGKPRLDDDVLAKLPFPEIPAIREYLSLQKVAGLVGSGRTAWLLMEKNGRIHARYKTAGTVTGRCSHSSPNIAQVPSVSTTPEGEIILGIAGGYGFECRELFIPPPGWVQVGVDMSGLELRCLAHYLFRWDQGLYASTIRTGDIHTLNQQAANLPTRNAAKTFIYALLYGAGDAKIGSIVNPQGTEDEQKKAGKVLKDRFMKALPAMEKLRNAVMRQATKGYIKGLDGRKLTIRKPHAALNTLLQSAGAIACKMWLLLTIDALNAQGLVWGKDYALMANIHDEAQFAARNQEIAKNIADTCCQMATKAGEVLGMRCRLDGEAKIGSSWAQCH